MIEFTEFTEKLNSSELVSHAWDEIDRDQASAGLLIDTISNEFKDWQPPKPLVVVPKIVADYIKTQKDNDYDGNAFLILKHYESFKQDGNDSELDMWIATNFNDFLEAIVNGYTVEKENLYILKHIDMSKLYTDVSLYLAHGFCKELDHVFYKDVNVHNADECHFTQSEIDKLNIGSYEKIEVHQ